MNNTKVPVGISSCLLGEPVRFDKGHKRDAYIVGTLSHYFDFHPFCPEMAIGLGIPRPTMHLIKQNNSVRCVVIKDTSNDVTDRLREYAEQVNHTELCGYILKKDSPSCGMERVKIYAGEVPRREGVGIYAEVMMRNYPLLPVEEEGRLGDAGLRENFIQRVYVLYRWKQLLANGLTPQSLTNFHARHKLIIMSHGDYQPLGQLLAGVTKANVAEIAEQYILQLMTLLKVVVKRKSHVNVLQHIQGYLKKDLSADNKAELCELIERYRHGEVPLMKKDLSADNKAELCELIERYRHGEVPLIVPLTLLKHHFRQSPDAYIEDSYYMSPYPQELQLINQL